MLSGVIRRLIGDHLTQFSEKPVTLFIKVSLLAQSAYFQFFRRDHHQSHALFGATSDAVKRLIMWEAHFETTGTPSRIKRAVMLFKLSFFSKTCMKQPTFSLDFVPKKSVSTLQLWPLSCFRSHHKRGYSYKQATYCLLALPATVLPNEPQKDQNSLPFALI